MKLFFVPRLTLNNHSVFGASLPRCAQIRGIDAGGGALSSDRPPFTDGSEPVSSGDVMPYTSEQLFAFLADCGITALTVEHAPLLTVEDAKTHRGLTEGAHTKNLFLKDRKDALFLVVLQEDAAVDLKTLHKTIGASGKLSFGSADLLLEVLGVIPGAVSPFSAINDTERRVAIALDEALLQSGKLNHHPLVNTKTTTIGRDDLLTFLQKIDHEPKILPASVPRLAQ
jgi:Ala-tRNA(Pro) deacylase